VASYTRVVPPPAASGELQGHRGERPGLTSIITLSWDQVHHTKGLVESVRANTDAPYELIIVDNGSEKETREYVESVADTCLLNPDNRGFAAGMNQGAGAAKGEYLVFINNDAVVPPGWASRLIDTAGLMERVGIVTSTVTAGGSFVTVRAGPHDVVREIMPYSLPPAAVCYLMPREAFQAAGGWCEEYRLGGAEDVDLCFTMWALGWRVLVDERVLIEHQSKATVGTKLRDWEEIWRRNRGLLIDRWSSAEPLAVGADREVESLLHAMRAKASGVSELIPLVDELVAQLARRAQASARERAMLAAGVAQSWRETARQRQIAANLREALSQSLPRQVYRRYLSRPLRALGLEPLVRRLLGRPRSTQ
jgi:GT2 family glycosyltransferase